MFDKLKVYLLIGAIFTIGLVLTIALPILLERIELLNTIFIVVIVLGTFAYFFGIIFYKFRDPKDGLIKSLLLLPWRFGTAYIKLFLRSIPGTIVFALVNGLALKLTELFGFQNPLDHNTTFWNDIGLVLYFTGFQLCVFWLLLKLFDKK